MDRLVAAEDCGWDVVCNVTSMGNSMLEDIATDVLESMNTMFNDFFTSWVTDAADPVIGGKGAEWMAFVTGPLQVLLLTVGLMVAAGRSLLMSRGEALAEAGPRFFRAVLVAAAGTTIAGILVPASTELARWILKSAQQVDPPNGMVGDLGTFGNNVILALTFGIIGLLLVGIQWGIMFLRAIALTVIVPFWPVAAAGAMFEKHQAAYEKITTWILAFVLYSPIAASLYGLSIVLRAGYDGVEGVIYGLVVFVLAVACLPALMKLVAPVASAVGNASAGGILAGTARVVIAGAAVGAAVVATGGAAAPAAAGGGGAGAGTGAAAGSGAAGTAGSAGAAGSTGTTGATGAAGASGETARASESTTSGAAPTTPSAQTAAPPPATRREAAAGAAHLREVAYLLPQGGQNSWRDTIDE